MQTTVVYRFLCVLVLSIVCVPLVAQDNLFRVRETKPLSFRTNDTFKVGPGSTLELSFRSLEILEPNGAADFQCLLQCGTEQDLAFAILLKPDDDTGVAQIGLVTSFADAFNEERFIPLTVNDSGVSELMLERGAIYHIVLVLTADEGIVDVYLDGHPQGSLDCHVDPNKSAGKTLTLGGKLGVQGAIPFEGEVGALRIWKSALPEPSIMALTTFGRNCDPFELSMLHEYGYLMAHGDFRGRTPAKCKLVFPNRHFGGVWRQKNATIKSNVDGRGTFLDFPVYTFLPDANNDFQVYEDTNYIGQISMAGSETDWIFRHGDGWPPINFKIKTIRKAGRPYTELVCARLSNIPRPFAGKQTGSVSLIRGSLDADGVGFNTSKFFSKAEKDRQKLNDDMTAVFLLGNNVRYKNVIYRGYNMAKMDKFNLFNCGVDRADNFLFARPEKGLFSIDSNQIRILPADLSISNLNMGQSSSESYYVSNAMEYSQLVTSRMGAGVSGSLTIGTGATSPVSVQGTVNLNVVLQSENSKELAAMETKNQDKMVSISSYEHYDLMHKRDMTRLDPTFRIALLSLYTECKDLDRASRQDTINAFFDDWGTHFVFGGTFGAIKWTERTLDEETVRTMNRASWNQFVSVNEGKTGNESQFSTTMTDMMKSVSESTRSVGGNTAGDANSPAGPGDEPAPIRLDMRLVSQLCSPQYFPENQEIYTDLRTWFDLGYPKYLKIIVARQLVEKNPSAEFKKKAEKFLETGEWNSLEPKLYQVQVVESQLDFHDSSTGAKLSEIETRFVDSVSINVNLESATGKSQYVFLNNQKRNQFALSSNQVAHFKAFEPQKNEVVIVSMEGLVTVRIGESIIPVRVNQMARERPTDAQFYFDPAMKPAGTFSGSVRNWAKSIINFDSAAVRFAFNEAKRKRNFYFSQKKGLGEMQTITHALGPFAKGKQLKPCYIVVTTKYRLTQVPSTSSLWANMAANSRSSIKSDDRRFGTFLAGPKKANVDFLANRSTMSALRPPRRPSKILVTTGDGN